MKSTPVHTNIHPSSSFVSIHWLQVPFFLRDIWSVSKWRRIYESLDRVLLGTKKILRKARDPFVIHFSCFVSFNAFWSCFGFVQKSRGPCNTSKGTAVNATSCKRRIGCVIEKRMLSRSFRLSDVAILWAGTCDEVTECSNLFCRFPPSFSTGFRHWMHFFIGRLVLCARNRV